MAKKHGKKRVKQPVAANKLPNFDDEIKNPQSELEEEVAVPSATPVYDESARSEPEVDLEEVEAEIESVREAEVVPAGEEEVEEIAPVSYDGMLDDENENEDFEVGTATELNEDKIDDENTSANHGMAGDRGDLAGDQSATSREDVHSAAAEAEAAAPNLADDTQVADDAEEIGAELAHEKTTSLEGDLAEVQSDIKADEIGRVLNYEPRSHVFRKIVIAIVSILVLILVAAVTALILNETHVFDLLDKKDETTAVEETPTVGKLPLETEYVPTLDAEGKAVEHLQYDLAAGAEFEIKVAKQKGEQLNGLNLDGQSLDDEQYTVEDLGDFLKLNLKPEVMRELAGGEHELALTLKDGEAERKLGVRFEVQGELKCAEGEKLENQTCVPAEKTTPAESKPATTQKPSTNPGHTSANMNTNNDVNDAGSNIETPNLGGSSTPNTVVGEKSEEQKVCESKVGPAGVVVLHWQDEAEAATIDWQYVRFATNARMIWANNTCLPSVIYSAKMSVESGKGERVNMSDSSLASFVNDYLSKLQNDARTDIVIWIWDANDLGQAKFEYVGNALAVLEQ